MSISIDLSKAHITRKHGDIIAVYTWVNDERALVLIPAHRPNSSWYVVCESAAWKYDEVEYIAKQCATACEVLGIEPSTSNWARIATIINEGIPDLIRMPTGPEQEQGRSLGEMFLSADGERIKAEDVRVPVNNGATYG